MATATPRLLHYMFLSLVPPGAPPRPANLSRAYDYWMRSCVRANPAYKIVLWTRDDCDRLIATRHASDDGQQPKSRGVRDEAPPDGQG